MKGIQIAYTKWQNRKRDLVYKKLKMIYNESYSSCNIDTQANKDRDSKNESVGSNFLLEISDYNPYSKKYYLRVQARKEKEELARKEEEKRNRSRRDIEYLSHELSRMLRDLGELSMISTLGDTPRKDDMYKNPAGKKGSGRNLSNLSNSSSLIKFNFKKNKVSQEKLVELPNRKTVLRESPKDKAKDPILRLSPKFLMTNQN